MEREVGGGIGMGNTCKPMADSFQCMTKSTTIKKKKFLSMEIGNGEQVCLCDDLNKISLIGLEPY